MDNLIGRDLLIRSLRQELIGPSPAGDPLDISQPVIFDKKEDAYGPWYDLHSGEEILQRDRPTKRYGIGVLYPASTPADETMGADDEDMDDALTINESLESTSDLIGSEKSSQPTDMDSDDFDLSLANAYRPSSIAVSFLIEPSDTEELSVQVLGGRYYPIEVTVADSRRTWWVRSEITINAKFSTSELNVKRPSVVRAVIDANNIEGLNLEVLAYVRPRDETSLVTVALINRSIVDDQSEEQSCLFQLQLRVFAKRDNGYGCILPYPSSDSVILDEEQESLNLLYRESPVFAVGHGCAADWEGPLGQQSVSEVSAQSLPMYEAPIITPEIKDEQGNLIKISMARLAGLDGSDDWLEDCRSLVARYRNWIDIQRSKANELPGEHTAAAYRHLQRCDKAADRIAAGMKLLQRDKRVAKAFKLANHAILLQQLRSRSNPREVVVNSTGRFSIIDPLEVPEWHEASGRGQWYPFQIAFILAALPSVANSDHIDRRVVELIWFPTGGGKTEAYLGLSAFSLFLRRLRDPSDSGTDIIMRYTLRLLTTQQFLRAASLICAMEYLRSSQSDDLGSEPFTIGIWLGGGATPNDRHTACSVLRSLNRGDKFTENLFLLLRCPWCSAKMGPISKDRQAPRNSPRVAGYKEASGSVIFYCPDTTCYFKEKLPVMVVDEDIYGSAPSMVIGTVDKFAMLAWKPEARALFGIDSFGVRKSSPPNLIVQDELHLISGPLGSVVGLYEVLIEELCTDSRNGQELPPKIVSSTATIRRYADQVLALYGRDRVALFPPSALNANDSFFANYATDNEGELCPGRIYLGVHGGGLGSVQTAQVRTFSALLQTPNMMQSELRDPWWTLLVFFNSLRELGTSVSLVQSDIPDYLRVIQSRYGLDNNQIRRIRLPKELTSRLRQDEIPKAIDELSKTSDSGDAIDICLASSVIEVGVDIDRLSLMTVFGQPKSTSQYIQVTGRIGRRWRERPGLVVTIFSPSKPRDRSHFERFRSYHERLYAQVEPTSVTPFAPPVLSRALHAVVCAYVRQTGLHSVNPWPFPEDQVSEVTQILRKRVRCVDLNEAQRFEQMLSQRLHEWRAWERIDWSSSFWSADGRAPLLRRAGEWVPPEVERVTWQTPTSMRSVDAECMAEVTGAYVIERGDSIDQG